MTGFESDKFASVKGIAPFCGTYRFTLTTGSSLLRLVLMNLVAPFLSISPVIASIVSAACCAC